MTAVVVSTDCLGCGHGQGFHSGELAPQCTRHGCTCLRYRPASPVAKSEVSPPAPVVRPKTEAMLPCPAAGCDREFSRANGLTRHLREGHGAGVTETRSDADSPSPEPDQPENGPREVTAASAGQLPAAPHSGRDTESRGDPHRDTQPETDNEGAALAPTPRVRRCVVCHSMVEAAPFRYLCDECQDAADAARGVGDAFVPKVHTDDLVLLLVDVLGQHLDMPPISDMLRMAFAVRDALAEQGWSVVESEPAT